MNNRWTHRPSIQEMKETILSGTLTSTFNVSELNTMKLLFDLFEQSVLLREACESQLQEIYEGPCITEVNQELINSCQEFDELIKRNK